MSELKKKKSWVIWVFLLLIFPVFLWLFVYVSQCVWAHRQEEYKPKIEKVVLTEKTDYDTFFQQTGLGKEAIDTLLQSGDFEKIEEVQDAFCEADNVQCVSVLGWFTRSDRIESSQSAPLVDLRPGDILISFSTHSMGWRHGHAGLVIDEKQILECTSLGKDSRIVKSKHWRKYSNYAVLRVKDSTVHERRRVAEFAKKHLQGIPYYLTAGFVGVKAPDTTKPYFGLQCAYLVWYAWQAFGYDLDSDGGRLVTAQDIWKSDLLELVQIYGMDPPL